MSRSPASPLPGHVCRIPSRSALPQKNNPQLLEETPNTPNSSFHLQGERHHACCLGCRITKEHPQLKPSIRHARSAMAGKERAGQHGNRGSARKAEATGSRASHEIKQQLSPSAPQGSHEPGRATQWAGATQNWGAHRHHPGPPGATPALLRAWDR